MDSFDDSRNSLINGVLTPEYHSSMHGTTKRSSPSMTSVPTIDNAAYLPELSSRVTSTFLFVTAPSPNLFSQRAVLSWRVNWPVKKVDFWFCVGSENVNVKITISKTF